MWTLSIGIILSCIIYHNHSVPSYFTCSAGDFVDLVRRGFYTGMEIQRADGFVVQTGKPDGDVSQVLAALGARALCLCCM